MIFDFISGRDYEEPIRYLTFDCYQTLGDKEAGKIYTTITIKHDKVNQTKTDESGNLSKLNEQEVEDLLQYIDQMV